jgi:hypothetical protein
VLVSGYNTYDQLGLGADPETDDPPGPPFRTLRPVPGLTNIVAIAAGTYHSLALDASGVVYAWGYNGEGQIGDGTEISRDGPVAVFNGATAIWRRNPSLAGRRHRRAGVGVGRQQRQATLALSLVPSTGWGDGVYQTDVVLGEDAAWAYVEGVRECQNFCVWGVFLSSPFATTMMRVGAVGNRVLGGFPSPGGRVLCVHGDGSVHARLHSTPGVS